MKLLLLKTLLRRQAKDDGYVLPIVIAIGLVMVLLGAVNLTSANEENLNAVSKNSRSDALGIAEVGIAKYREMLNRNRILTVYNRNEWISNNVNGVDVAAQTCDVMSATTNGWASNEPPGTAFNAANWRAVTLDEPIINRDLNNDGDVTDNGINIGWFKIVDYEYDNDGVLGGTDNDGVIDATDDSGVFSVLSDANTDDDAEPGLPPHSITDENDTDDDGTSNARGILTVKARTPDDSEAQIQVEIPLRINPQDMNNLAPALWIGSGNTLSLGGLVVGDSDGNDITDDLINNLTGAAGADGIPDANIVASLPNDGVNDGCGDIPSVNNNTIISDPRSLPSIDVITQTITDVRTAGIGDQTNNFNPAAAFLGAIGDDNYNPDADPATFDPVVDCAVADDCRYYYDEIPAPATLVQGYQADGVAKVTLYSETNLAISPTTDITIGSTVSSKFMEIYSTGDISINTGGNNVTINALIHTPGTLTISGGGTVTINGSVWVGNFTNNIATLGAVKINPDMTRISSTSLDRSYEFYTTTNNRTPRPLTGSPTNWKTEEVN